MVWVSYKSLEEIKMVYIINSIQERDIFGSLIYA